MLDKKKIFGLSSLARINLYKIKGAKTKKYECCYQLETLNHVTKKHEVGQETSIAFFDTEEKGRMYIEALDKGMEIGKYHIE